MRERQSFETPKPLQGIAYVFIAYNQAARCGHLGWGFLMERSEDPDQSDNDIFYFGSTDHLLKTPYWDLVSLCKYMYVEPEAPTDWWSGTGTRRQMLQEMKHGHHVRYQAFKAITVYEARPLAAQHTAKGTASRGWAVLSNNCLHQTKLILDSYGAARLLPDIESPITHRIPRRWFDNINAERTWL